MTASCQAHQTRYQRHQLTDAVSGTGASGASGGASGGASAFAHLPGVVPLVPLVCNVIKFWPKKLKKGGPTQKRGHMYNNVQTRGTRGT